MKNWINSAYTDGTKYFVSNPLPQKGETITISFRILEAAPVTKIFLRSKQNGVEILDEMMKCRAENGLQYYSKTATLYEDVFHYHIYIVTDECVYFLNQRGISLHIPDETYDYRILTGYLQPSWVKSAVFYQIFPDRFFNGNPDNDVKPGEYIFNGYPTQKIENWDTPPEAYATSHGLDFYGGDLEGIKAKIPYLKKLGVNALYLNPIFYAATVHKYDCLDYFTVDPHFGGDEALATLSEALHTEGMKLILDVSINHTGISHKWFNRDGVFFPKDTGAYNNPDSPEREYYFFDDNNNYKAWFDVETLPTLNYTSQALRDKLYRLPDSVVKKWLKPPYNIDGWRFDVADTMARNNEIQLHEEVWCELRTSIKEENKDAYILCEDWTDCAEFLGGDKWDSAMNYFGCARPLREFAGAYDLFLARNIYLRDKSYKPTAKHAADRIRSHLTKLPTVIQQNQFNLIDSHDVSRLHCIDNIDLRHVCGAVITTFMLPGAPSIYYGDEADIDGGGAREDDIGARFPMPWSRDFESVDTFKLYSTLCRLKKEKPALSEGSFKIVSDNDYVLAFARFTFDSLFISVFSTDDEERDIQVFLEHYGLQNANYHIQYGNVVVKSDGAAVTLTIPSHESCLVEFIAHR
jgi:alpha-glucosidase